MWEVEGDVRICSFFVADLLECSSTRCALDHPAIDGADGGSYFMRGKENSDCLTLIFTRVWQMYGLMLQVEPWKDLNKQMLSVTGLLSSFFAAIRLCNVLNTTEYISSNVLTHV